MSKNNTEEKYHNLKITREGLCDVIPSEDENLNWLRKRNDETLRQEVESALEVYPDLNTADIKVEVKEGVVILEGVADNENQIRVAVSTVLAPLGVKDVDNRLRIRGQGDRNLGEHMDDMRITAAIKAKIFGQEGLSGRDIHVETKDGIVTLTGQVEDSNHARLAMHVAKRVNGVREVHNHLNFADEPVHG